MREEGRIKLFKINVLKSKFDNTGRCLISVKENEFKYLLFCLKHVT